MTDYELKALPTAQKRTSRHKKFVYVDGDFVYKGPYRENEASYKNAVKFASAMQLLEDAHPLPPSLRTATPIVDTIKQGDYIYLKYINVGKHVIPTDAVERVSTKIDEDVPVLKRTSFVTRVSEMEKLWTSEDITVATLQHLYFRYLLGIGDSGSHNVLVREDGATSGRVVAGIDLEEMRRQDVSPPKDAVEALFKKPSRAQRSLYSPYVKHIRLLTNAAMSKVEKDLAGLDIDTAECMARIAAFAGLLQ